MAGQMGPEETVSQVKQSLVVFETCLCGDGPFLVASAAVVSPVCAAKCRPRLRAKKLDL